MGGAGQYFSGALDEIAIWAGSAGTSDDAIELYNAGTASVDLLTVSLGQPNHWWRMGDDDTNPTVIDHGTSGSNGTMVNMDASNFVAGPPGGGTGEYIQWVPGSVNIRLDHSKVANLTGSNSWTGTNHFSGSTAFSGNVGFYNVTPITKPTVSGSRGSNAALQSLVESLASLGLINNTTTDT